MKSNLLKSIFISLILVMGVNNTWADPWLCRTTAGGNKGTKTVGDKLNNGINWEYTYTTNGDWSTGTDLQVYVGTSTSQYVAVNGYWKKDDGSDKQVGANIGDVEFDRSGKWYAVGKYKASGKTAYTTTNNTWTSNTTFSMGKNDEPYWVVNPPAVSNFSVSVTGYHSGSGTEADPYIVLYGESLNIELSGSKAKTDANSTLQYNTSGTWNTTTSRTISNITSATNTSVTVKMRCHNSSASLSGTESSKTIYYRAEDVHTVTIKNDGHGTTNPTGAQSNVGQVTGLSIKATPAANYEFVNWTITSGSGSFGSTTSASTTFKPTSDATIQANFRSTATHSLTVVAGAGIASVTGSKDPVTLNSTYPITATPKTGYTFSTWTADPAANASFGSATTANTTVTVENGSVTVTASATENMSTLTTSNKYDAGNPGYAVPTALVNSIGYETTATVTATAAGNGYTFTGWTLTNCTRTDGGAADATSITVRSNGDGKAATVTANYAEDLTTSWVLKGSFVDDFKTAYEFVKKSGESTGKVAYVSLDLADSKAYQFKVVNGNTWYGNNNSDAQYWIKATVENWKFYSNAGNCHMQSSVAGTYTFKIDFSGTDPEVSVEFPTAYKITYGVGTNKGTNAVTTNPDIKSGASVLASTKITFSKGDTKAGYTWMNWNDKADGTGTNLGEGDTYVSSNRTGDITVYACYDLNTYTITYNTNGGNSIEQKTYNVTTATFNLPTPNKTGYTFAGWFDNEELTGDAVTQITKGTTGDKTFHAKWTANTSTITWDLNDGSETTTTSTYTYDGDPVHLPENPTRTGYTFNGWWTAETDGEKITDVGKDNKPTSNVTYYAQWNEILSTITIVTNPAEGGSVTVDDKTFTPGNTVQVGVATTKKVTAVPNEGYGVATWGVSNREIVNASGGATVTLKSDGSGSTGTLTANFIGLEYTITFDKQEGTEGTDKATVRYMSNEYSVSPVEAPTRAGYTFGGYYTDGAGVQVVSAEGQWLANATDYTDADRKWLVKENTTLYAKWTANTYIVTLDQEGAAEKGDASVRADYNANMPELGKLPTAQNGYAFMGYFDQKDGKGTQYYDSIGTSAHVWNKADDATLYAYFAKAKITTINLDKTTFEPVEAGSTGFVTATPIIEPEPTGTTTICWRLLYSNGTPVEGHNASTEGCEQKNQVKFSIAGLASGNYKIEAVLRTGDNCESGTELSTKTVNFTIASTYTITVKYTCDGKEIMAPTKKPAHVTEETEITAPDITGYTFSSWEAGDGVTIKSTNGNSVKITAFYDGYLTAKYTARPMVYFKNTLDWEKVYVYTFSNNAWWNDNGQGVHPATNRLEQGEMKLVEGTDDIYYFELTKTDDDYTQDHNANNNYIAFSNVDYRNDNGAFRSGKAIYRGDHKAELTLFIPQADQTPSTTNQTKYYNKGIWMKYNSTESGYQMPTNNSVNDNPPGLGTDDGQGWSTYGNKFTAQTPGGYKFSITKHLEANKTYEFKIKNYVYVKDWQDQDKNEWYGYNENSNTITDSKCTELHFHEESDKKHDCGNAKIKTTAEGEYIFTIDLSKGKVLLSVEYPVAVGDYRVIYTDTATWSQGTAHGANWYHPSRIIKKNKANEPTKDIISFFISFGKNTMMRFQKVQSITNGNVTWEDAGEARIPDNIKEAGVYNFIVTQTANGESISMEDNAEPYTGNYYIRCDAVGGKWDNYKTHSENRMTYSAFSESKANSFGEKFSHYATKYCTNGTKIEFTIANDYSPCISDTLAQDITNPLDNLDSEGRLLNNDIYSANVRFMWNRKTNKISRAYVGPAADKQSQFLMLRTKDEIQGAAGELDPDEGDILDEENNIYAARFADTQNWMYERTIRVKPGTRVKLYASYPNGYHIYIENNTGWKDVALFAWKDGGDQPLGNWPGVQPTRTVEIEGKTYYDFPVNKYVFGSKLIFNNNGGGQQKEDYQIQTIGDYYLTASSNSQLSRVKFVSTTVEATAQYFRGAYDNNNATWDDNNSIVILGGSGTDWNTIRVIYDFKTNRLMAALVPDQEVSEEKIIAADVMIIRKHQENATCITLTNDNSKLTEVKTVYGSLQFNRWVLNNRDSEKSGIEFCTKKIDNQDTYDEEVTNEHHPILDPKDQKTIYDRALYFISFPFDVHLSDVFGFGTYGTHWVISTYNGQRRAQNGYFVDNCMNEDCTNWDYIWDPSDFTMKANQGYLLSLDLDLMKYNNTDFWLHNIDQVELFFPSTADLETIEKTNYQMPSLSKKDYECTINFNKANPGEDGYNPANDHRVRDSYWRCIGVPSFANYDGSLYKTEQDAENEENPINWKDKYTWQADNAAFPFLYEWNVQDNSLQVQNTSNFNFRATFAYLVQNGNSIYWSAVNAKPSNIVARRQVASEINNYDWKITIARNSEVEDQTFVRLSDNEKVTTEFDFNQDLSKEFNYGRSDIYTLIGYEKAAANSLPLSEQTTLIPLGLSIEYNGDYTIAMPDGTANIGVTLIDTESNTRTNLSAGMEYTLTLKKGDYNNRFFIEISPIQQTPTDIEYVENSHDDQARKVLIDNILYIVRDGQMFDARGARVK